MAQEYPGLEIKIIDPAAVLAREAKAGNPAAIREQQRQALARLRRESQEREARIRRAAAGLA